MRSIDHFLSKPLRSLALVVMGGSLSIMAACAEPSGEIGEVPPDETPSSEIVKAPPAIETSSGAAEIALAEHLAAIGAKKYGAWWCPHCHAQQALFGAEAFEKVTYVECDPEGQDSQTEVCQAAGVEGFPSWEINGQLYPGIQQLPTLAQISAYSGPTDFTNQLPVE